MDQQQQQRISEAAERFTDALVQEYKALSDRGVAAQEAGAHLTQEFFNEVIDNLRTQTEEARRMTQQLADQQQRAQEATRSLTQASVGAYTEFLNSMFTFYRGSVEAAERSVGEAKRSTEAPPEGQTTGPDLPIADYDSLNANEVIERTEGLSVEEIRRLREHEAQTKNRRTLLERLDQRIEAGSPT
jgi:uncharacterized protein YdiU (UPF0061 family)